LSSTGCYYGHLAVGQTRLLLAREPISEVLEDPATQPELRAKLSLVEETRAFAATLGLEVGDQYTSYVPWEMDRVITTVVATNPGEVDAAGFWFPIVGTLPYKGYFDIERAQREALRLQKKGLDTCLFAIPAYSTLGWLPDPLTSPMLDATSGRLVETVLHELVHATVFLKDQPDFNESVAKFVGEEAAVRFFDERDSTDHGEHSGPSIPDQRARIDEDRLVSAELLAFRSRVSELYAEDLQTGERTRRRTKLDEDARRRLAELPLEIRDPAKLAESIRLNDACLALQGTYSGDRTKHQRVLEALGGDLSRFIARLREIESSDDPRDAFFELGIPAAPQG